MSHVTLGKSFFGDETFSVCGYGNIFVWSWHTEGRCSSANNRRL